jgi:thiamine-phosphate pyrophosphorylase
MLLEKLPQGFLPILDENHALGRTSFEIIEALLEVDISTFILRNKNKNVEEYQQYIKEISSIQDSMDFNFIIHHHAELAKDSNCLGVHLTANSMPITEARKLLGNKKLIGYSAHSIDEVVEAEQQGANYVILGAIHPTPKPGPHPVLGIEKLIIACKLGIPVYAVGGINATNIHIIKQSGARGFCALRSIYDGDLEHNIMKMNLLWDGRGVH